MATNLLDLFGHVQKQGDLGRAEGKRMRLADLASQAYAAPQAQRSGFVQQAIATDPDAGFALNQQLQGDDDARMQRVGQMAGMLLSAPEQSRAAIYSSQIVPEMNKLGFGDGLPAQWTDDLLPSVQQIAQQLGVGSGGNVQSTFVDAQGNRVAIMRDGSTRVLGRNDAGMSQQTLTVEGPDGRSRQFTFDKRTGGYMPAQLGGTQPMGGEVPFSIDPSLPPEVQAAIRQSEASGQPLPAVIGGDPFVGRRPEDEEAAKTAAREQVEIGFLPQRQAIETQGEIDRTRGTEQAKAEVERVVAEPARQEKVRQVLAKTANLTRTIDNAIGRVGAMTAGFLGSMMDEIPGTAANDLRVTVNTIKANLAFDALQAMREASPTGGALGAVSERELALLESAVASLDQSQTPEQMRQALQRVKQHYQAWESAVRQADREAASRVGGNAATGGFRILD